MDPLIEQIREELSDAISNNQIVLPTLPEVALKVRDAAENPDADAAAIARVVSNDAAMSARIIRVTNSPLLRAPTPIMDLRLAISRLGIQYTCNLAIGLAMEQMFQATSNMIDTRMRAVWGRSTEVAGISAVLAKTCTRLPADQATLAGLLHQIGVLPILRFAEEQGRLLRQADLLDSVIRELHGEFGQLILETWNFPPEIACVPAQYLNFSRERASADYADIVMVAHLQSHTELNVDYSHIDWHSISAFRRLGLDPGINAMEIEDLSEAMAASIASLQ
jgi:HD-like signal output (HDOD) protein